MDIEYVSHIEFVVGDGSDEAPKLFIYLVEVGQDSNQYGLFVQPEGSAGGRLMALFDTGAPLEVLMSTIIALQDARVARMSGRAVDAFHRIDTFGEPEGD